MEKGYIKLYRQLQANKLWLSEPFTRGQAWVDMLLLANHADGYIRKRGVRVDIKRGQLGWSERKMAERWKWSRGKVRRFLNELKTDLQIEPQKNNVTTLITITNYNEFQTTEPQTVPQTDHKQYQNNNVKKGKNEKNTAYSAEFQQIWEAYPKKTDKKKSWLKWQSMNGERPDIETLLSAIENQKLSRSWKEGFVPHMTTWLNGARWEDEVESDSGDDIMQWSRK